MERVKYYSRTWLQAASKYQGVFTIYSNSIIKDQTPKVISLEIKLVFLLDFINNGYHACIPVCCYENDLQFS